MEKIEKLREISQKYNIALVYLFGSQKENSVKILNGEKVDINDPLADIDVGIVVFGKRNLQHSGKTQSLLEHI